MNSTNSLTIFLVTNTINIITLITDVFLINYCNTSVTQICVKYPILGTGTFLFQFLSPSSLGAHFYYYYKEQFT